MLEERTWEASVDCVGAMLIDQKTVDPVGASNLWRSLSRIASSVVASMTSKSRQRKRFEVRKQMKLNKLNELLLRVSINEPEKCTPVYTSKQ